MVLRYFIPASPRLDRGGQGGRYCCLGAGLDSAVGSREGRHALYVTVSRLGHQVSGFGDVVKHTASPGLTRGLLACPSPAAIASGPRIRSGDTEGSLRGSATIRFPSGLTGGSVRDSHGPSGQAGGRAGMVLRYFIPASPRLDRGGQGGRYCCLGAVPDSAVGPWEGRHALYVTASRLGCQVPGVGDVVKHTVPPGLTRGLLVCPCPAAIESGPRITSGDARGSSQRSSHHPHPLSRRLDRRGCPGGPWTLRSSRRESGGVKI